MSERINLLTGALLVFVLFLTAGCAKNVAGLSYNTSPQATAGVSAEQSAAAEFNPDRMLIWRAGLGIEIADVREAVARAGTIAEQSGGYLEWKAETAESSAHVRLRIPVSKFNAALHTFEELGKVISKNVTGEDITEKYIDVEARLKNKYALRDRLKLLLEKAVNVKDILEIETELNRVQSDIDSMEGTIKSLKGQVDLATVDLNLKKERILGPLGYVFKGLWWGVKKLFVLSD